MTNQDLRSQLDENLDEAEWEWLIPHVQRDSVIVVATELDLLDVGEAIASDKAKEVQNWIDEALIAKPSAAQMGEWNMQKEKRFNTLIVQPFVLVQEKAAA
ncbi:uncharacterized conserved small protein [Rivularia sp. PCC 7116]|uniref:DUF2288 domain-containing protein n=1 Tax=Rivularia sp. PCC 7116 TaxID=373994 RepID=UPI00029F4432|nr:DUF2288 domain-containing protein [Rivularia sp. PCC 7116]AFY52711.1 uncharacterized conserved small protein [Rivularia sp. PCC 7116]